MGDRPRVRNRFCRTYSQPHPDPQERKQIHLALDPLSSIRHQASARQSSLLTVRGSSLSSHHPSKLSYFDQPTIEVPLRHSNALPPQRTRNPRPRSSILPPRYPRPRRNGPALPRHVRRRISPPRPRRPASALPRTASNHPPRSNSRHDAASGSRASDTPEGASFSEERPQKPSEEKKEGEKDRKTKETTERRTRNCYSVTRSLPRGILRRPGPISGLVPGRRPAILARLFALRKTLSQRFPRQLPPTRPRQRVRSLRRPHRHAPRSIPDGPSPPSSRQIPIRTQHSSRPCPTQSLLPPPHQLSHPPRAPSLQVAQALLFTPRTEGPVRFSLTARTRSLPPSRNRYRPCSDVESRPPDELSGTGLARCADASPIAMWVGAHWCDCAGPNPEVE